MARLDPHSFADSAHPRVTHLDLHARVDFATKTLAAEATLRFDAPSSGVLDLDTRDLAIEQVRSADGESLPFDLGVADVILGQRLRIRIGAKTAAIKIRYRTSPNASALQWLSPEQTMGGKHPFLFTQCQAIHARSVVPLPDTPRCRITYRAQLTAPAALRTLMAAAHVERMVSGDEATEIYEMKEPIPPYLFAFAVGNLKSHDLGKRSRVWAEPQTLEGAAWEFAGVDTMLTAAEALLGPYDWERFDLLVMPPSFPYGGMENPRLTFLTPTLLAKDRSLVNVVAHELAHSWTGNLVSNASAEDFWLNEGFTVFAERKLLEAIEGEEVAQLHNALGRRELDDALKQFEKKPELTQLRTKLTGVDPDEAYSQVPYEKGCFFLQALEAAAGKEAFKAFLREYAKRFRFQSITTDDFLAFAREKIPAALEQARWREWLDGPGVPSNALPARSTRLSRIEALKGAFPTDEMAKAWSPVEWQVFLRDLPSPLPLDKCEELDRRFGLTARTNYEVLADWLDLAVRAGYAKAVPRTEEVLGKVGRMKYLKPLYLALASRPETLTVARTCFERNRAGYHPIAAHVVETALKAKNA